VHRDYKGALQALPTWYAISWKRNQLAFKDGKIKGKNRIANILFYYSLINQFWQLTKFTGESVKVHQFQLMGTKSSLSFNLWGIQFHLMGIL